jgi:hypothetical protein
VKLERAENPGGEHHESRDKSAHRPIPNGQVQRREHHPRCGDRDDTCHHSPLFTERPSPVKYCSAGHQEDPCDGLGRKAIVPCATN